MFKRKEITIRDLNLGKEVIIYTPSNIYECTIGDFTQIGPFVEIQKGVTIGKNCKVQSHSFICELVRIQDNVFIGHGVMFINDKFSSGAPASGNKELWKETLIRSNVSIGSNATILPVEICENVVVGAGSVVTKDIDKPGIYAGNPAKLLKEI